MADCVTNKSIHIIDFGWLGWQISGRTFEGGFAFPFARIIFLLTRLWAMEEQYRTCPAFPKIVAIDYGFANTYRPIRLTEKRPSHPTLPDFLNIGIVMYN